MKEKSQGQQLMEKLSYKAVNIWEKSSEEYKSKMFDFCDAYQRFLDLGKTEREFTAESVKLLKEKGFVQLSDIKEAVKPGAKVFKVIRDKALIAVVVGEKPLSDGLNMVGAHVDSPRIDLKPTPLYEEDGFAMLKTHYYGGIKKYQWVTIPLAMHGTVILKDGSKVELKIGEEEGEPVFTITDLLPHLAKDQMEKKMSEGITGEGLNILFGSIPYNDPEVSEKVKLNVLDILNKQYGIVEEDFVSAEIEFVPADKARDIGLDRSMVGGYGQDDRVCSYTALRAILEIEKPENTALCILTDKEEVGSMGNTGAESNMLVDFLVELGMHENKDYNDLYIRNALNNSKMLSADVNAAVDPNFSDVMDKRNATYLGKGLILQKYGGVRGKAGGSEANAEFVGLLRKLFNDNNIFWQTGELGRVDLGGGGTIALYIANLGAEVIDCGVAVLSMHSPFEITSKADIYNCYNAYKVFMEKA